MKGVVSLVHVKGTFVQVKPLFDNTFTLPLMSTKSALALTGPLLRVLIGSLCCMSVVIGQSNYFGFALRHSIENLCK